jgi:hypothetical protein
MHNPLHWDERYELFISRAGFLPLAQLINRGLPLMDAAALTTRSTFHLVRSR